MMHRAILIFIFFFGVFVSLSAQNDTISFYHESQKINNTGMYVLGTWATTNMALGAYGWKNGVGENKYFHQMNLFWNTVNFSIAAYALTNHYLTDYSTMNAGEMIQKHNSTQSLYLINAGLDIVYIGAGFGLRKWANNKLKHQHRLRGYGNSVILQGSFLLVFDAIMYGIQYGRTNSFLQNTDITLGLNTIGINYTF